jgi:O-antigen/teichoic acid export membrane protein
MITLADRFRKISQSKAERTAVSFAFFNIAAIAVRLIGSLIMVRLVTPDVLGQFNGLTLIQSYIPPLHLGIYDGLARQLPFLLGQGKTEQAEGITSTAEQWARITAIVVAGIALTISLWFFINTDWHRAFAWGTNAICIIYLLYGSYLEVILRTAQDFNRLIKANLFNSLFLSVSVSLLLISEYYGLCARASFAAIFIVIYLWFNRPFKIRAQWSKNNFKQLFKVGFPILIVNAMSLWWSALDNTFVLLFIGNEGLGLYTLANMICYATVLPQAFGQVLYPKLSYDFGNQNNMRVIILTVWRQSLIIFYISLFFGAVLWKILPVILSYLAPKYIEGICAAQWALVLVVVFSFSPTYIVFNVLLMQKEAFIVVLFGIAVYTIIVLWLRQIQPLDLTIFPKAMIIGRITQYGATAFIHYHILKTTRQSTKGAFF